MNIYRKKMVFLIMVLILCILVSIFLGRFFISPKMFFDVLSDSIKGVENNPIESSIIFELRIPRIIMNILVGAGLSISGVAFQGIFQNPLVSPDIISVSSGSAFGAVLGILLFGMNSYVIMLALLFGILLFIKSKRRKFCTFSDTFWYGYNCSFFSINLTCKIYSRSL